jgi:hypothetical protein
MCFTLLHILTPLLQDIELPPEYEDLSESMSRAVKTMLYEEKQARLEAEQREEELTSKYLRDESKERQKALDAKVYTCNICFDELKIDGIYILEDCNHR